ncbi:MAG TPA: DUF3108 domain-containing protein [Alphaproteobacteria bacterium]|nr:DUF3108 domain-containing protein [Alphaproteobacteria bacterium]HOO81526.1 DUF3108 domain-containing protein [Alphaproteobacteria bacterium]
MAAAALLWLVSTADPASAGETLRQQLVYEVYAGGIHAVQAHMDIDLSKKNKYSLVLDAKTRGFLGSLIPWEGSFESYGWILKDGKYQPERHQSTATWRNEADIKEYLYNKNGSFKSLRITDEHSAAELREVDDEVTNGTVDILSATLQVLDAYNEMETCAGESEIFDGKRRFKQIFRHEEAVTLTESKYNIYGGPAAKCTVEVVPVNGEWHKKPRGWMSIQEQGRAKGTMPTVWIAQVAENGPAVPVKIRVKTAYGTLFMHLAEYKSADTVLIAEKRMPEDE